MPLWGIALAVGPNYNLDVDAEREKQAFEAIQKAAKLAQHAPSGWTGASRNGRKSWRVRNRPQIEEFLI
jgi:hypothetical protein